MKLRITDRERRWRLRLEKLNDVSWNASKRLCFWGIFCFVETLILEHDKFHPVVRWIALIMVLISAVGIAHAFCELHAISRLEKHLKGR